MTPPPDILEKILVRKAEEVAERARRLPVQELSRLVESAPPPRGFMAAIQKRITTGKAAVIAEIKKASPSKGLLRPEFRPSEIAKSYEQHGATCLSVLTDIDFFQGSDEDLKEVRSVCSLPVLRKDFTIDAYQVYEARTLGADCILLIVAALGDAQLRELTQLASELGMDVLVEVHDQEELQRAMTLNTRLIGINNRDLHTFETRLETTIDLLPHISGNRIVVTESGIHVPSDIAFMRGNGVNAFLIGEVFMRADDPGKKLEEFILN